MNSAGLVKELDRCAKCGQCRSVCPVFLVLKDETLVARGRLAIIQAQAESSKDISELYAKILNTCLMCRRCEENCPSLVDTSAVFKSERQRIADEKGLPLLLRLGFRWVLPRRWLYNVIMRLGSLANSLFGKSSAPVRQLPLSFANLFRRLPRLAARSALQIHNPSFITHNLTKVSIFIGCAANYICPEIIDSLTDILDKLKIPYIIPQGQVCCGMPALLSGDEQTARRLMKINQGVFNTDTIITVCPTCNRMLTEEYALKGVKVLDAMEFLNEASPLQLLTAKLQIRTAYHQPCHSAGTKTPEIIKAFLKANTDYQKIEDICCGGGGLFTFKFPELSGLIGQARMEGLEQIIQSIEDKDSALTLVTNCPGCMMQLEYLLADNPDIRVRHALNLIADDCKTDSSSPHIRK